MSIGTITRWLVALGLMAGLSLPGLSASAQDQREVTLIAQLAFEQIAQREAEEAARIEAEHQAQLEEQSRLKQVYQTYLGAARRTAQAIIIEKRRSATQDQVDSLRRKARIIIDEVQDATKQRVPQELDPVFEELEKLISVSPEELVRANAQLGKMRIELGRGNDLTWVDQTAILYALAESKEHSAVIASNVKFREQLSDDEARAIDECNRRRMVLGLNPLSIDMKLVACCRDHSSDMIQHDFFSHTSPIEGKSSPWDRAKNFGTSASGENIAAGYGDGIKVTMGWWYSPGHLKNMMGKGHKRIAVGQEQKHYTQMFGR
ncbi:MAG: CAP domain-containing protein [Planctomycetota bacterium]